jgi:hypothetical protein
MRVHESYESDTWQRIYEPDHAHEILAEVEKTSPNILPRSGNPQSSGCEQSKRPSTIFSKSS